MDWRNFEDEVSHEDYKSCLFSCQYFLRLCSCTVRSIWYHLLTNRFFCFCLFLELTHLPWLWQQLHHYHSEASAHKTAVQVYTFIQKIFKLKCLIFIRQFSIFRLLCFFSLWNTICKLRVLYRMSWFW